MKAYQPIKSTMGGKEPMPFVYVEKRAAEIWCKDSTEEWVSYEAKEVNVRELSSDDGEVDGLVVYINRLSADSMIREKAMRKLSDEERRVLGLRKKDPKTKVDTRILDKAISKLSREERRAFDQQGKDLVAKKRSRKVRPLAERTTKDIWPLAKKVHGLVKIRALLDAANIASSYNSSSSHQHDLGDCILAKLNVLRPKVRRNPYMQ